jgi:hypothetical protein
VVPLKNICDETRIFDVKDQRVEVLTIVAKSQLHGGSPNEGKHNETAACPKSKTIFPGSKTRRHEQVLITGMASRLES